MEETETTEETITYQELPDTIGVIDYMKWRRCGRSIADAVFHSKGFPRIPNLGNKLLADKRAVLLFEMKLYDSPYFMEALAKELAGKEGVQNGRSI